MTAVNKKGKRKISMKNNKGIGVSLRKNRYDNEIGLEVEIQLTPIFKSHFWPNNSFSLTGLKSDFHDGPFFSNLCSPLKHTESIHSKQPIEMISKRGQDESMKQLNRINATRHTASQTEAFSDGRQYSVVSKPKIHAFSEFFTHTIRITPKAKIIPNWEFFFWLLMSAGQSRMEQLNHAALCIGVLMMWWWCLSGYTDFVRPPTGALIIPLRVDDGTFYIDFQTLWEEKKTVRELYREKKWNPLDFYDRCGVKKRDKNHIKL